MNCAELADRAPTDLEHNRRAVVLRTGLAIVSFATLEGFIRARTAEIAGHLGRSGLKFAELPAGLQEACTFGALKGLVFQAELGRRQGEDVTALIQDHAHRISTSAGPTFLVSDLSLGMARSNLNQEDLRQILSAVGISKPWEPIRLLVGRAGIPMLSILDAFQMGARRRHAAAHQQDANVLLSELVAFLTEAIGIAFGFDAFLSRAARRIIARDPTFLPGPTPIASQDFRIRFLHYEGGSAFREVIEGQTRAVRRSTMLAPALVHAEGGARANQELLVLVDRRKMPYDWRISDI